LLRGDLAPAVALPCLLSCVSLELQVAPGDPPSLALRPGFIEIAVIQLGELSLGGLARPLRLGARLIGFVGLAPGFFGCFLGFFSGLSALLTLLSEFLAFFLFPPPINPPAQRSAGGPARDTGRRVYVARRRLAVIRTPSVVAPRARPEEERGRQKQEAQ